MKKIFFIVLILVLFYSFTGLVKAETKKSFIELKPQQPAAVVTMDPVSEQSKRERYDLARDWKADKLKQHLAIAGAEALDRGTPNAANFQIVSGTSHWQSDSFGDLVWTGACINNGSTSGVFVRVDINVYNAAHTLLGSDYTYIWGGDNVKLSSSGLYTNAIGGGDYGFFRIWTSIPYAQATTIVYQFSYNTYAHTAAMAQLAFNGSVYYTNYSGYLDFFGSIKNSSSNYITYYTIVAFAAFNPTNTYVLDVDFSYVDGANYGMSSSAIYPGTSEPFDSWFLFAPYTSPPGSYMSSFEWDEAQSGSMEEKDPPFGQFATPVDGSTVSSSIAVTGWALDDSGVDTVKIYRKEGNSLQYVGDAIFVDGARPDVAALYPQYPNNTRAGWGYMMLTNFLPNGGNGTYEIHAVAMDVYGKTTDLGAKTIHCDNAHAVKPFGAIDTPTQGGDASGSAFVNWGWALTPQPDSIPTDGSTINVWVNGVNKGHPTYNKYRSDLATLFPGYANSNGAAGVFYLNTTPYGNGLHTIQWTAKDSGNDSDGIGSRYFNISNTNRSGGTSGSSASGLPLGTALPKPNRFTSGQIAALPVNNAGPVRFLRGFDEDTLADFVPLDENGSNRISVQELERVEIHLARQENTESVYEGYLVVGDRLVSLPVGSTLDTESGVFSWSPGPGFLGTYHLVFVESGPEGSVARKDVLVDIRPKTDY